MVCPQVWADRSEDNLSRCPVPRSVLSLVCPSPFCTQWDTQKKSGFAEKEGLFSLKQLALPAENPWLLVLFQPALPKAWQIPGVKKTPREGENEFLAVLCRRSAPQPLHIFLVHLGSNSFRLGGIWNFCCWRWLKFALSYLVCQFLWLWKETKCCLC